MDFQRQITDKRKIKFFMVDNAVYDMGLSCEALSLYCAVARYANNETGQAYFSGKKWKRHHKVGSSKLASALRELIGHGLIRETGNKTAIGAKYFELADSAEYIKPAGGWPTVGEGVAQGRAGGWPTVGEGGSPRQATNNTNKTRLKKQDNAGKPATSPIYKPICDIFSAGFQAIENAPLSWVGKEKAYGSAVNTIIKQAQSCVDDKENPDALLSEIHRRAASLYREIETERRNKAAGRKFDAYILKTKFVPSTLMSRWNNYPVSKIIDLPLNIGSAEIPDEELARHAEVSKHA